MAVKIMRKDRVLGPSETTTKWNGSGENENNNSAAASPSHQVSASRSRLTREIGILRRLRHPNLVVLRDVLASKDKVYVVMEFVTGGELFDRVAAEGPLPESVARRMFQQLADALAHCHSAGVFHRDLKPENVLLTREGDVKLSDFGFGHLSISTSGGGGSGENDDFMLSTACGTPAFVAPEVLARKGYEGGPADIWSLGVTLAVMLAGRLPFDEPSLPRLFRRIAAAEFSLPPWVPRGGADLVSAILKADPGERPTLERIFEHPWVRPGLRRATVSGVVVVVVGGGGGGGRVAVVGSGGQSRKDGEREAPPSPRSAAAAAAEEDPFSDSVPPVAERHLDAAEAAEASVRGGVGTGGANSTDLRRRPSGTVKMNAFTLLSAALDLSGLLDKREGCVRRHTRFTTRCSLGQVHAAVARAAEAVGGMAFRGGVAAIEALSAAAAAAAATAHSSRPLPASAWRARLDLPVVAASACSSYPSSTIAASSGDNSGHRAPSPHRLFVAARVDISPLLPGTLVVDVTRAGGAAAADFYQAYGPFEAAVLEELAAEKEKEEEGGKEREKEKAPSASPPPPPAPPPPSPPPPSPPPLDPSPPPPAPPPLFASTNAAAAAARSSGTATPDPSSSSSDAAAAASVVSARAHGSLLASSTAAAALAFSAGERGGGGGVVGGVPHVSSLRSLRSAGSGRGGGGRAQGQGQRRSGREDFWDDDSSSGDNFDSFDDDDDGEDDLSQFGGAIDGDGSDGNGSENEEEVAAVKRLVLE